MLQSSLSDVSEAAMSMIAQSEIVKLKVLKILKATTVQYFINFLEEIRN